MREPVVDIERLKQALPHGAGIDSEWSIRVYQNGNVLCSASFHCMNENGYYDGWEDFSFRIFRKGEIVDWSGVRISERRRSAFGLRDYLDDGIAFAMKEVLDAAN